MTRTFSARRSGALGLVVVMAIAIAFGASGCAVSAEAGTAPPASSPAVTPTGTPVPPPTPTPTRVPVDPEAPAIAQAARDLVRATDGWALVETRTALDVAAAQLETDLVVATNSPTDHDSARIDADIAAVLGGVAAVRGEVVGTSIRVLNEETLEADQAIRDSVYRGIVEQQTAGAPTSDTPRLVAQLVTATRAAQDAQAAYLSAAQRSTSSGSESSGSEPFGGGGSWGGYGSAMEFVKSNYPPGTFYDCKATPEGESCQTDWPLPDRIK